MALGSVRIDSPGGIALLPVRPPYHLYRTLGCGQAFRWRVGTAGAIGVFRGKPVRLSQTSEGIACEGLADEGSLRHLRHYLGLDEPLEAIERVLRQDPVLGSLLPATSGLALLHQEPWECLISFIISAFNNIPKIELSLHRLARQFGEEVGERVWAFPSPEQLAGASLRDLRRCALGYRGPYVRDVSRRVVSGDVDLQAIEREEYLPARISGRCVGEAGSRALVLRGPPQDRAPNPRVCARALRTPGWVRPATLVPLYPQHRTANEAS